MSKNCTAQTRKPCLLAGLSCIEICECTDCQNVTQEAATDETAEVDDGISSDIQYEQSFLDDIGSTYTKEIKFLMTSLCFERVQQLKDIQ